MKIAHISDAHLGRQQYHLAEREEDYYAAFAEALRAAREADAVLVTGDLFDARRPNTRALLRALEIIAESGMRVYAIGGNHDFSYLRPEDTPLRILDKVGLAKLVCFREEDLGGVWLYGACAMPKSRAEEYRQRIASARPGSVLAIHQAVEGVRANYPASADEYTMPQRVFAGLKAVHIAAGHVHDHGARHPLGILWAGSLEIWDSSEFEVWDWVQGRWEKAQDAAPKGFYIIDVSGKAASVKEVVLKPRRRAVKLRVFAREPRDFEIALNSAVPLFDSKGVLVRVELYGEVAEQLRLGDYEGLFARAIPVGVVDKTKRREQRAVRAGSAYEAVERALRERLGDGADAVARALAYLRDGDKAMAKRTMEQWIYAKVDRG